jgi:hypothetical protein
MGTREIVQGLYDAAGKGDMEAFFAQLSDDLVLTEPGFLPYGGVYKGKEGMQAMLGPASEVLNIPTLRVHYIVVEGDRAIARLSINRTGTDETLIIAEESLVRDGKIAEITIYVHDAGSLVVPA